MAGLNKKSKGINIFASNKTVNGGATPLMTTGMGRKGQTSGEIRKGGSMRAPAGPINPAGWVQRFRNTQVGVRGKRK